MAEVKNIIIADNDENIEKLSNHCSEVDTIKQSKEMREVISNLKKTIKAKNLTALSAPAIGSDMRIFCVDFHDSEIKTFINPLLVDVKGLSLSKESCTSIPGKTFIRPRNNDITIMYQRPLGQVETRNVKGMAAYVIQHEMDHLDGLLLSDIGMEIDEDYDKLSDEEKQEIIGMYLDSLDLKKQQIDECVENDEEAKKLSDGIKFMEAKIRGEISTD